MTTNDDEHEPKPVRLIVDLTKYAEGLTRGSMGQTVGTYGPWSKKNPKAFIGVHFPAQGVTLDVLKKSLELIREDEDDEE